MKDNHICHACYWRFSCDKAEDFDDTYECEDCNDFYCADDPDYADRALYEQIEHERMNFRHEWNQYITQYDRL